jgi:hypothetical protein
MKKRNLFALKIAIIIVSFTLVGVACSKKSNRESTNISNSDIVTTIDPGVSVGNVHKGMTSEQVVEKLGEPTRRSAFILEYPQYGFSVMFGKKNTALVVFCGDASGLPDSQLVKAFTARTKDGIGMGSSRADIVKAYGETKDTIPLPPGEQNLPGRDSLVYKKLGLTFSLVDDKVHHMIVDFRQF